MLQNIKLDEDLDKEAALLAKFDHPNVLGLYGTISLTDRIALILELMNLGDLKTFLRMRTPRCASYSQFPPALIQTELLNITNQVSFIEIINIIF